MAISVPQAPERVRPPDTDLRRACLFAASPDVVLALNGGSHVEEPVAAELHLDHVELPALTPDPFCVLTSHFEPDRPVGTRGAVVVSEHFELDRVQLMPLECFLHHEPSRLSAIPAAPAILFADHDAEISRPE